MIYRFARDLAENLSRRGYPVSVRYAGAVIREGSAGLVLDVSRDGDGGESIEVRPGANKATPNTPAIRRIPVLVRVSAHSEIPGARLNEHEAAADHLVDAVIVEIFAWASLAGSQVQWAPAMSGLSERAVGVDYSLRFTLARAVCERTYSGAARQIATVSDAATTVDTDPEE